VRTEVVTDVIAGTSAGGINGAMLGFVVANGRTLETTGAGNPIKEIWQRLGAIETLLASKAPDSALDDLFLFQGCADAFYTLGSTTALPDAAPTRMRLTVTATDSGGYAVEQEGVTARDHRLELRFRNVPRPEGSAILLSPSLREAIARAVPGQQVGAGTAWPFPESATSRDLRGDHAPNLLARAARTTASFPIAFAPSQLPLDDETGSIDGDTTGLTATPALREVVSAHGVSLGDGPNRYAIDGGVWDNAPFAAVLRDIDRSPSSREVDRRLVYVIYTDEDLPDQPHDGRTRRVHRNSSIRSLTRSRRRPNVAFADDLERIRADIAQQKVRRRAFAWLLADGEPDVFTLAPQQVSPHIAGR
jgi:predicted acylesterase/phospholipase RssA